MCGGQGWLARRNQAGRLAGQELLPSKVKTNEHVAAATWVHNSLFRVVSARAVVADPILHDTVVAEVQKLVWQLPLET